MAYKYGDNGNNTLIGTNYTDYIYGYGGSDWLYGLNGDDFLYGGTGQDYFYGGNGIDTVNFIHSSSNWYVDLNAKSASADGLTEYVDSIENVIMGSGNDIVYGSSADNWLQGGAGNDTLAGRGGNDSISGGSGIDTAVFSYSYGSYSLSLSGNDILVTGSSEGTDRVYSDVEKFNFGGSIYTRQQIIDDLTQPQEPDLIIQNISLNDTSLQAGQNLTVSWNIRNDGNGNASPSTTAIFLTNGSQSWSLGTVSTGSISSNGSLFQSTTITIPNDLAAGDNYQITVYADIYNNINNESNEYNNQSMSQYVTLASTATPPNLTISDDSELEGNNLVFTVNLDQDATQTLRIYYITTDGTATAGEDYTAPTQPAYVTIQAGQRTAQITIATTQDNTYEPDQSFTVYVTGLTDVSGNAVTITLNDQSAVGTILNDDSATTIDFVRSDINTTATLGVGQTVNGTINQDDLGGNHIDADYYKVILTAGQSYTFSANANQSTTGTLNQVFMRLRDASGNSITSFASAEGAMPSFTYDVPGSGSQTYYLAVSAGGGGSWWDKIGDFSLDLTANGTVTVANQTPYAQGSSITAAPGESIPLTDLFTYGDRDGLSDIVSFAVQDRTFDGGYLTFNGVQMASNTVFEKPIGEIGQWSFVAGATGSDTIGFNAIDSQNAFNNSVVAAVAVQTTAAPVLQSASELFAASGGKITVMAEFALAAYFKTNIDVANGLLEDGWKIPDAISLLNAGGYYISDNASAFVAESGDGNSLVIAFTGTDGDSLDFVDYLPFADHYAKFMNLFNAITFSDYTNIYIVGHSLGAAMAQAFMVDSPASLKNLEFPPKVEAVTFANPGYELSLFSETNNLVNISIKGDFVAGLGLSTQVAGDRYWIDPILSSISGPFALHKMELYRQIAKYIDEVGYESVIQSLKTNSNDDNKRIDLYLGGREDAGYVVSSPLDVTYTWNETLSTGLVSVGITVLEQIVYNSVVVVKEEVTTGKQLVVFASDVTATSLDIAADVGNVVMSSLVDGGKYLLNKSNGFSSLLFKAGDAALEAIINPLNGTDITQNTIYFEGGLSDDVLSGSAADRRLVADGGAGNDKLTGGLIGDSLNGGDGVDILTGNGGNDKLDGGDYTDLTSFQGQVYRLYQAALDRAPDEGGFLGWAAQLENGASLVSITTGFILSAEFQTTYGALNNSAFTTLLYNNVLNRTPDSGGLANWVAQLNGGASRESVVNGFSQSVEFIGNTNFDSSAYVQNTVYDDMLGQTYRLYQAALDRAPDAGGFQNWVAQLESGTSLVSITTGFILSAEFQTTYGALNNSAFTTLLYNNVLNRTPDSGGLANWVAQLNGGSSRENVLNGFSESLEFIGNTTANLESYVRGLSIWENTLDGGVGDDLLLGGRGGDIFVFDANEDGTDTVSGLQDWDTIQFKNFSYANAALALSNFSQSGSNVLFSDQGVDIIFTNTNLASIDVDMFAFA